MMRSRTGRRALCLCALAVGLMGFGASAAQAATWMTGGVNLASGSEKAIKGKIVGPSKTILTRIAGIHVIFLCTGTTFVSAGLLGPNRWHLIIVFTGCRTILLTKKEEEKGETGKVFASCEPHTGAEKGVITTNKLKGELKEHTTGEGVAALEPETGETLATIEMGEECSIGEAVPIIGKVGLVDSSGMAGLLTEAKVHKVKEGPLTELWAISKTEEHKAKLTGEDEVELASGEAWNGLLP